MAFLKLDARTILVMTALMGPLMAVVLYSMRRNYPVSVRGLGWWASGALVMFVGIVLIATRDLLPAVFSILLGNVLMMGGSLMWVAGTEKFLGLPSSMRTCLPLLALASLAVAALLLVWPDYMLRVLVINGGMIAIALLHSHRLVLHSRFEFASRFLVLALMASACAWLVHATGALIGYTGGSVFAPTSFNVACNAALTMTTLLTLIGFVLLASERVREEFERLATRDAVHVLVHAVRHDEGLVGIPAHDLLRRAHLVHAERGAVRAGGVGLLRRRVADVRADDDHRRLIRDSLCGLD